MSGNTSPPGGIDASVVHVNLAMGIVGVAFNSFFFGLIMMQTAYYWQHYWKNDKLYLRCMVMLVTVLTVFHMAFLTLTVWNFHIQSRNRAPESSITWSMGAQSIVNVLGIFAVHSFYLKRLCTLSQNRILITVLGVLMLEVFALGMYTSICAITIPNPSVPTNVAHAETALCASLVVTDVTMTTLLITLFLRLSNSGMKSERLVKQLIFYTLTTGMLTAICAVVAFITHLKFRGTIISAAFYDFGASLYACSLLSSLNARQSLRGKLMETGNGFNTGGATMPSIPRFAPVPLGGTSASLMTTTNATRSHVQTHVEQDTTVQSDPPRSISERLRIRSRPSKEAPPSPHDSERLSLPSTKDFSANSSDPGLAV